MARYLIVKVDDDSTGPDCVFARVRKALHEFPEVSDMGVAGAAGLTPFEQTVVVNAFEAAMERAKAAQKAIEEDRAQTPEGYRWVMCTTDVLGLEAPQRHLVKRRGVVSLCGGTASDEWIVRRTGFRKKCPECIALAEALL